MPSVSAQQPSVAPTQSAINHEPNSEANTAVLAVGNAEVLAGASVGNTDIEQSRVQQRHILALMGIEVWAQRSTQTVPVDYRARLEKKEGANHLVATAPVAPVQNSVVSVPTFADSKPTPTSNPKLRPDASSTQQGSTQAHLAQAHLAQVKASLLSTGLNQVAPLETNSPATDSPAKAEPIPDKLAPLQQSTATQAIAFELIGVKYRNWVLLVDAVVLKEQSLSQLWNNMLQALSLTPEYLQFPICAGISDKASAQASVAGFVFRLGKSEGVQVAALTPMPDGAHPDTLIRLPYLSEMLADSDKKRQLWQRLSEQDP